jgi:hypothetical protein
MSKRYPGGLITKTPVTPTTSSAPGVWTLEQALQYIKAGTWPSPPVPDPYFPYVTMLLHGDGTNGAQNNTFLDSSTNNFTITRNGNTTQGSFSPYGSNWSNNFNGSTDYLSVADNAALTLDANFTIEFWFNQTSSGNFGILQHRNGASWASGDFQIQTPSNAILFNTPNGSVSTATFTLNTWNHCAIVRSGSTITAYLNGVVSNTWTNSTSYTGNGGLVRIGELFDGTHYYFPGYLSNLRIVKGTAVYTSAFTPPTTPLTAISGTSLLTCQSNRFIDNSTNNFAITRNGTPSVQRFSPFSPSAAYSTSTIGGSGYFDGSGDYLTVANDNTFDTNSTFTLECWFYQPTSGNATLFARGGGAASWSTTDGNQFVLFIESGTLYWQWNNGGPPSISTTAPAAGQWHHVAVGYNGTTTRFWLNGVSVGTSTTSYLLPTTRNIIRAGISPYGTNPLTGYISNLRFVKGTDVYGVGNSTITVPTAPLTAITNTSLLLNYTNGGIFDNAMMNNLETVGNAQISTSVFKYGTGSMSLSASGNTLRTQYNNPSLSMGTGDFTIEGWVYLSSTPSTNGVFQMSGTSGGFVNNQTANLALGTNSSSTWQIYAKNTYTISSSTTIPVGSWIHFALVRSGTTTVLYINGTALITLTADSTNYSTPYIGLGSIYDATSYPLGGYIDDLRVTKGYARYTSNFTPPTAAFPNQ